jgi:hypothetical protein
VRAASSRDAGLAALIERVRGRISDGIEAHAIGIASVWMAEEAGASSAGSRGHRDRFPRSQVGRARYDDLLEYRRRQRNQAELAFADMVADTERLGLYDADPAEVKAALRATSPFTVTVSYRQHPVRGTGQQMN